MFWYFHKGLEPHLQRAHAGHTQAVGGNGGQALSFASLCQSCAAVPPHPTFSSNTIVKRPVFRTIEFGSAEFSEECRLRDAVLRKPLGLNLLNEDLEREREQMHFGLFDTSGFLIASVIAAPISPTSTQLRQMAVAPSHARKGHGSAILQLLEKHLFEHGFRHLCLHARSTAVLFYKKQGYIESGCFFTKLGIPHIFMEKYLHDNEQRAEGGAGNPAKPGA